MSAQQNATEAEIQAQANEAAENEAQDAAQTEIPAENANAETAETEASAEPTAEALSARIAELELYISEADSREQDIQLRARAEIENIRRRSEQDVEKAHKFALEKFSKELLDVVDNLERALQALTNTEDEAVKNLAQGVELTHKNLLGTLVKFGVQAVGEVGEAFNPELHQAISMQPAEGISANHISVVLQKGYTLHGRVIRPAMVMVAA